MKKEKLYQKLAADGRHDDTPVLQQLLDGETGEVTLPNGLYLVTRPLVIHDNTCLTLAPGAVMRLADGANCAILLNDKKEQRSGNRNITLRGGVWDGNNEGQTRLPLERRQAMQAYDDNAYFGVLTWFVGVQNLHLHDLTVKNPESFGLTLSNVENFTVEHITFDYNQLRPNMDGVHVMGAAKNGRICDIKGATNDDLVALNCDDAFAYESSSGPIENVLVDGLYSENGYTAVRLLSCGNPMRNVQIRNVFGTYRYYGVSFTHHNVHPGAAVWFDNISVDGVFCSKPPQDPNENPVIWFVRGVRCGSVTLQNVHRTEQTESRALTLQIDPEVTIDWLFVRDFTQRFPEGVAPLPPVRCEGHIQNPQGEWAAFTRHFTQNEG